MTRAGLALAVVALTACGWGSREHTPDGPGPTPMSGAVRPGAYCAPRGDTGVAGDGTPMVCVGTPQPRWRAEVRDR